ncbi:MAG: deoxyhypusine synthase family protein [Magnetococcales bacterium]|nr:deoxyhypusine synthase family protein [Magnetococcales bacterium]
MRCEADYHRPESDGLDPVRPLDLNHTNSVSALMSAYRDASFGARRLGEAADLLQQMVQDPQCCTILTLSGAMTVAKMGLVICEMVERGYVQIIISTGALMTHGLVESMERHHYKYRPDLDDRQLYQRGYNRVYDTLEPESNLDEAAAMIQAVLGDSALPQPLSSHALTRAIGAWLHQRYPQGRGPLLSAYRCNVPVIIPALSDSEMGLDFAVHNWQRRLSGQTPLGYDPFIDLDFYAERARTAQRLGIFTIGGGVPRNYAQQVGPYLEILDHRAGIRLERPARFHYGIRICPDPDHLGGLSGCSYREGVSWGKFVPEEEGGRYAEVLTDATIAWPLIVKAVMERVPQRRG